MSARVVTTQEELDAALADPAINEIEIRSERGVWLELAATNDKCVRAWDSASVSASGSASVSASGSASVRAWDSASVRAWDSASVSASGSASVRAWGSASVRASSHVAVHLHSGRAQVEGGVLIDHTDVDQSDPATWCSYHGVIAGDGHAVLYKAVRDDWRSAHGTSYQPGTTASCTDFIADGECGHGLHVSPSPTQAAAYDHETTRYVEVRVPVAGINVLGPDKCKAASVVCVREVDVHGRPITAEAAAGASA